jgi:acyl transferase domain-containing protein
MALHAGDCESAIVGGVNLILGPDMTVDMSEMGILAADGRSKTFDAKADGYGRAEAAVVVQVKRLADAVRDNDPIRAVIRASCINCDGRTGGVSTPNAEVQAALMRRGHALAGVDVNQTAMIECHGTGTAVGDPTEATAVAELLGGAGVYIGSVSGCEMNRSDC